LSTPTGPSTATNALSTANARFDADRAQHRDKRAVDRERSLEQALAQSSVDLAGAQSSPSERLRKVEDACRLANALAQLPEAQQEAIVLQYWHGMTLAEIGRRLERTPVAVAGLLKRGLQRLREILGESC
jgi:RNA polymerase sigma-70 factor (ECF subfamily)